MWCGQCAFFLLRVGLSLCLVWAGGLVCGLMCIGVGVLVAGDAVKGTHAVVVISYAALYDAFLAPFAFFLVRRVLAMHSRLRDPWWRRPERNHPPPTGFRFPLP